ncbi:KpsF/GutQ family sugar-phosphate isomerase [Neisseria weaveri]|uniref:KpsF/GutQ family sugar-phosphate isomerase n=1 Tax=Neisseria weaveri TaxID=28091 RepID=UPI00022320A1|nr:KpsF/GutQ family sugar-phosphate isomerase [Neisseria weaveri]EGV35646.1 polysialic acid capsule expression protein, arabinose-5-phosphate isomerase [Neisseria weaveri ATCC 51223]SAY51694.1 KpsF [Neisseria weaveri]
MKSEILQHALATMRQEAEAIETMATRLNEQFEQAVQAIMGMKGRVIVVGMGKSGIIGQKIAATMASTGTPAFFVHPGEAFHGDLGMIKPVDVTLLISNSGETEEVIRILPFLQYQQNKIIAMTGNTHSTLAENADIVLDINVSREACSNNLAPTSSTTCTLVMGDALAMVLSSQKNFKPEDFARFHPGGSLGRKLLTRVSDVMKKKNLPTCTPDDLFKDVVHSINRGQSGLTLVMENNRLQGIITDGDIRRAFDREDNFTTLRAKDIMTPNPKWVAPDVRFGEAEAYMRASKINSLVVQNTEKEVVGILCIYDLKDAPPAV